MLKGIESIAIKLHLYPLKHWLTKPRGYADSAGGMIHVSFVTVMWFYEQKK